MARTDRPDLLVTFPNAGPGDACGTAHREEGPVVRAHCGVTQFSATKSVGAGATADSTDAAVVCRSFADPAAFAALFDRHFLAVASRLNRARRVLSAKLARPEEDQHG